VERAQGCLAVVQASGSHAKRLRRSIGMALGFVLQQLAARDPGTWTQVEPGGEVFLSFPGSQVKADFASQRKQSVCGQAGNSEQIDAAFFEQQVAYIDTLAEAVAGLNWFLRCWWPFDRDVGLLFDLFDKGLVTVSNLSLVGLVEVDSLS